MPYLTAVCQEILRIYSIVIAGFLQVVIPLRLWVINCQRKQSFIIPSIYPAHYREEVYPEPKKFKPERFLERQLTPYEYLPFAGGNRRCIGLAFAQYEMKIILATTFANFQLSFLNKRPVNAVRRDLTLAAPAGIKMIATEQTKLRQQSNSKHPETLI